MTGRVASVNVGVPRTVEWFGRKVRTAIWKAPVDGAVAVAGVNLAGDDQADRRVHGGHDKAVYAYAAEDYRWWQGELGHEVGPATFGENLTTEGVDLSVAVIGERWSVGSAVFEVSQPRLPCFKLGMRMGDAEFVDRFDSSGRFGAYLRIIDAGEVAAGQEISVVTRPGHGLRIGDLVQAHRDPTLELFERIAANADVAEGWRATAERALVRARRR
jgi:MOSC domain-containing protein YiiM